MITELLFLAMFTAVEFYIIKNDGFDFIEKRIQDNEDD